MTIKEIKPNVNNLKIVVMINKVIQGVTTTSKPYLTLILQDNTGSISARLWEVNEQDIVNLKIGVVINLLATSLTYNNEVQLKVVSYEVNENPSEEVLTNLLSTAPIKASEEWNLLLDTVKNFENETLKTLLTYMLEKNQEKFYTHPAAVKMHHNTRNGLLWHTVTMLKTAKAISVVYQDRQINHDLLYAGVILHDFGKIWELSDELVTSFTLAGQMMGHIVIGSEQVRVACHELNIDEKQPIINLLQHLILASHGKYEYGSPVLPKTLEAEILHHVDNLDAKITIIDEALKTIEINQNTNRLNSLENRMFYKHFDNKKNKG